MRYDDVIILDKPVSEYKIDELMDLIVKGYEEDNEHEHHEGCECNCGCHHHHDHEHHHHHDDDDDEIFKNQIIRPSHIFTKEELEKILSNVDEDIIRIKGYVNSKGGTLYLNYVLNEYNIYLGEKRDDTLVSIIGTSIDKNKYMELFNG